MLIWRQNAQGAGAPHQQPAASHNLYGVADGTGGHRGGETASRIAVQVVRNLLQGKTPEESSLRIGLEAANRRIFDMQRHEMALSGMGTTFDRAMGKPQPAAHRPRWRQPRLPVQHRAGALVCRTEDHSIVGELLRNKIITPAMAKTHPTAASSLPARWARTRPWSPISCAWKKLGDLWLICSDGLYNMLEDDEIAEILGALQDERAADRLLELALKHGGHDNVSLVLGRLRR